MNLTVDAKYLRISPKKMKIISASLIGLNTQTALDKLAFSRVKAGRLLMKVIRSGVANAQNNYKLEKDNLVVKSISVTKGPFFKRFQPVSRGMAHSIKKYTSHVKLTLKEEKIEKKGKIKVKDNKNIIAIGEKSGT